MLDKELEKWYAAQFELFQTEGWKGFVEMAEQLRTKYNNLKEVPDSDTFFTRKGQVDILDWVLTWESVVETQHKGAGDEQSTDL